MKKSPKLKNRDNLEKDKEREPDHANEQKDNRQWLMERPGDSLDDPEKSFVVIPTAEFDSFHKADEYCKSFGGYNYMLCHCEGSGSCVVNTYCCIDHVNCLQVNIISRNGKHQVYRHINSKHVNYQQEDSARGHVVSSLLKLELDNLIQADHSSKTIHDLLSQKFEQFPSLLELLPSINIINHRRKFIKDLIQMFTWADTKAVQTRNAYTQADRPEEPIVLACFQIPGLRDTAGIFITTRHLFQNLKAAIKMQSPEGICLTIANTMQFGLSEELRRREWVIVDIGAQGTIYNQHEKCYETKFYPFGFGFVIDESVKAYEEFFQTLKQMAQQLFGLELKVGIGCINRSSYVEEAFTLSFPGVRVLTFSDDSNSENFGLSYSASGIPGCLPVLPDRTRYVDLKERIKNSRATMMMSVIQYYLQQMLSDAGKSYRADLIGYYDQGPILPNVAREAHAYYDHKLFLPRPAIPGDGKKKRFAFTTNILMGNVSENDLNASHFVNQNPRHCEVIVDISREAPGRISNTLTLQECNLIRLKYSCNCEDYFRSGWCCSHVLCCGALIDKYSLSSFYNVEVVAPPHVIRFKKRSKQSMQQLSPGSKRRRKHFDSGCGESNTKTTEDHSEMKPEPSRDQNIEQIVPHINGKRCYVAAPDPHQVAAKKEVLEEMEQRSNALSQSLRETLRSIQDPRIPSQDKVSSVKQVREASKPKSIQPRAKAHLKPDTTISHSSARKHDHWNRVEKARYAGEKPPIPPFSPSS